MNADAYINALITKNPALAGKERLTITPKKFLEVVRQAFAEGEREGKASKTDNLFDRIFGPNR